MPCVTKMAERRMFAKTIVDSDAFLDMPLSTQALYFHLSMRADDEGFINNPKKIQRMIGCSGDDLKLLCAKNFIIPFESGVVVIKHWRIHNYIRADRLVETKYKDERDQLAIKENGSYTLCENQGQIEATGADDKRKTAFRNSSLPYSFVYKIRRAFNGHICPVCGKTMTSAYKQLMPTIQHNIPISKGGEHEIENISVICESCNTSIKDKETGALNNAEVIEMWDKIVSAERAKIDWFMNPTLLDKIDVGQMSVTCQTNDRIGKERISKVSRGQYSREREESASRNTHPSLDEVKEYFFEKSLNGDAEAFFDNYQSVGWIKANGAPIVDWKAVARIWSRKEKNFQNKPKKESVYSSDASYDLEAYRRTAIGLREVK